MRARSTRQGTRPTPRLAALLLLSAACSGPREAPGQAGEVPPPPRLTTEPWTDAFMQEAVLVARRIRISAPDRVAERFVALQDPDNVSIEIETTTDGLRQTYRVTGGDAMARGQLDAWQLAAEELLVVLQRPGRVDVELVAEGDAFFQRVGAGEGQRGSLLTFRGVVDWPEARP
jgi:hypothetical protein